MHDDAANFKFPSCIKCNSLQPQKLRTVIFVDADQIVRTDMGELYDMEYKKENLLRIHLFVTTIRIWVAIGFGNKYSSSKYSNLLHFFPQLLNEDLPNYAQYTVPIFSLPQEWLWCESWCGNATKSKAKTIDLCNNPMTKEPKLQGAKRIVSEWPDLDSEARQFTARIAGEDKDDTAGPEVIVTTPSPSQTDINTPEEGMESKSES
ncbi:hypothetical protein GIB67_026211 [Kingdonia uniflora]|uniref:Glucosyltransferase 24 catalytic domain-containing protein n=1 Tax=Kingdonia uniflora TaxID=39325 RepID=A0A7J7L9X9_9MAGN|nr:hypothetical protein GIB67_026211 [Kingdonia uniflora]